MNDTKMKSLDRDCRAGLGATRLFGKKVILSRSHSNGSLSRALI